MNFVFDLAFQITLFVLFVTALGFFFHFLKDNRTAALWSGFLAYLFIGLAVAFYLQNRINQPRVPSTAPVPMVSPSPKASAPFPTLSPSSSPETPESTPAPKAPKRSRASAPKGTKVAGGTADDKTRTPLGPSQSQAWRSNYDGLYEYEELRYTSYAEDYFGGVIWRWEYRIEMGDQVPRNIRGFCPEDDAEIRGYKGSALSHVTGRQITFFCQHHRHVRIEMPCGVSDDYEGVRNLIQEKLQSGEWRETVYLQRLRYA